MIELLKGEKDLNTLTTENSIRPNLLRNRKKEFFDNAATVFDDKREEGIKGKLAAERKEKTAYVVLLMDTQKYVWDMAEYLDVDETFLREALRHYGFLDI